MKDSFYINFKKVTKEQFEAHTLERRTNEAVMAIQKARYGNRFDIATLKAQRRKEIFSSWGNFAKWFRETEKLLWVKLTYPKGRYSVREISRGQFEITEFVSKEFKLSEQQVSARQSYRSACLKEYEASNKK